MQSKSTAFAGLGIMVALVGGVVAKQMGLSRMVSECTRLAEAIAEGERLEGLKVAPLKDAVRGQGLHITWPETPKPPEPPEGDEDGFIALSQKLALKAILMRTLPAQYLILESQGRKLFISSTQITRHFPEFVEEAPDS